MPKQAVVYILDGSPTMAQTPFGGDDSNNVSRFESAKRGILQMMGNLMLDSKQHECSLIVLKTPTTCHHLHNPQRKAQQQQQQQQNSNDDDDSDTEMEDNNIPDEEDEEESGSDTNDNDHDEIQFPHMTEYPFSGLARPTVPFLRQVHALEPDDNEGEELPKDGNFLDGLALAVDALQRRTARFAFERSIVLWTDAKGYKVRMDGDQVLPMVDKLRALNCRLYVVGMDFAFCQTRLNVEPAKVSSNNDVEEADAVGSSEVDGDVASKRLKTDPEAAASDDSETDEDDNDDEEDEEEDSDDEEEDNDNPNIRFYKTPEDRENLLMSLLKMTGGALWASDNLQQILQHDAGRPKTKQSASRFCKFIIIPKSVELPNCKFAVWAKPETSTGTFVQKVAEYEVNDDGETQTQVVQVDDDDDPDGTQSQLKRTKIVVKHNALGEEMLQDLETTRSYCKAEETKIHHVEDVAQAARYGDDLIPIGEAELQGLKAANAKIKTWNEPTIQIIGYKERRDVPRVYHQGPPYRVYAPRKNGREDVGLRALAQSLKNTEKVALCMFAKTRDTAPILAACFPNDDPLDAPLILMQLPFRNDVKPFPESVVKVMETTERENPIVRQQVDQCKALIASLDLSTQSDLPLYPENPFFKAWNRTLLARALDSEAPVVSDYQAVDMTTPPEMVQAAKPHLHNFRQAFPIQSRKEIEAQTKQNKKK